MKKLNDKERAEKVNQVFNSILDISDIAEKLAMESMESVSEPEYPGLNNSNRVFISKVLAQAVGCLADYGQGVASGSDIAGYRGGVDGWFL